MNPDILSGLRSVFDGKDNFMSAHRILKVRRHKRIVPEWVFNDKKIKEVLLKSFPKLREDETQRIRAGRWMRVIQLYFRSQKSYRETAEELGEKTRTIEMIIRS